MTHTEFCKLTAEFFCKMIAIYEVKVAGLEELPDVITWNGGHESWVYDIKMSRSDFLADLKKKCRTDQRQCGDYRYYVCYGDFISPDEVPPGWGLYWYIEGKDGKKGKFVYKKKSCDQCYYFYLHGKKMRSYDYKAWHRELRIFIHQIVCRAAYGLDNLVFNKRYHSDIKRRLE